MPLACLSVSLANVVPSTEVLAQLSPVKGALKLGGLQESHFVSFIKWLGRDAIPGLAV